MTQKKIGRNDPCWCGSGKKYKKCHANRSEEAPYEYHEMANELIRLRAGEKTCLYPVSGAGPCAVPVIKAHSISRSAALSKIARDGHVYQPDSNPYNLLKQKGIRYRLRGINEATTFTGFCAPLYLSPWIQKIWSRPMNSYFSCTTDPYAANFMSSGPHCLRMRC